MGSFTLSLEVEFGWGLIQYDRMDILSHRRRQETETLKRLLSVCEKYDIRISFDVVGHLFLDSPLESYDGPHNDGWFSNIPKTGVEADPEFYAPDLIQLIRESPVDHEICTHTFSHIEMGNVSEEVIQWELAKVREIHNAAGLPRPRSLVPPTHDRPERHHLREHGIQAVRVPQYRTPEANPPPTRAHQLYDIMSGKHPVMDPVEKEGIVETYSTKHLSLGSSLLPRGQAEPMPVFRAIPLAIRKCIHKRNLNKALDRAIEGQSNAHFWSHLADISNGVQWPLTKRFLKRAGKELQSGRITNKTMAELGTQKRLLEVS